MLSQAIRVYKYTKIQGPRFQRNYIIARDQKRDLHGMSFRSLPKIDRMLITRAICIQYTLPVGLLLIKFSFFFRPPKCSHGQDFRITPYINYAYIHCLKKTKDRHILCKTCMTSVTQRFLFPVSTVSTRNAWDHNSRFVY